jgi:8-oxo-dGTP diphosphatase
MAQSPIHKQKIQVDVHVVPFRVHDDELQVLVHEGAGGDRKTANQLIGGSMHADETADDAVKRHLSEQGDIRRAYFEQVHTFTAVDRNPEHRVIAIAYMALVHDAADHASEDDALAWVAVRSPGTLVADHGHILKEASRHVRERLETTNVVQYLLPKAFTLTELQRTYEAALNRSLDKRNFRRKVLDEDIVSTTGQKTSRNTKRPAELYQFSSKKVQRVNLF